MATRFYFPSTGTAGLSPAFGTGWNRTTGALRLDLVTSKIASAKANLTRTSTATSQEFHLGNQYIGPPLAAQTISGTVKGVIMAFENNDAYNGKVALVIRVVNSVGDHLVHLTNADAATPVFSATGANPPEVFVGVSPGTSRPFRDLDDEDDITLGSYACADGDRLVVEIGLRDVDTSTTRNGSIRVGDDAGADLTLVDGGTTDNDPWIEFTHDFAPQVMTSVTGSAAWQSSVVAGSM